MNDFACLDSDAVGIDDCDSLQSSSSEGLDVELLAWSKQESEGSSSTSGVVDTASLPDDSANDTSESTNTLDVSNG